ncbi:hypothetical protein GR11A_00061 [Vibrio phage vB_VcorM_GR11A]|nr:hypothetical protein GR11A_00061 [Vibrio phage vB_VcorM_GR11A]
MGFKHNGLEVKPVEGMGRGVFATKTIKANTLIFVSDVVTYSTAMADSLADSGMDEWVNDYQFFWSPAENDVPEMCAVVLSEGTLINHSLTQTNVKYVPDLKDEVMLFYTSRDIVAGEQLFICYDENLDDNLEPIDK